MCGRSRPGGLPAPPGHTAFPAPRRVSCATPVCAISTLRARAPCPPAWPLEGVGPDQDPPGKGAIAVPGVGVGCLVCKSLFNMRHYSVLGKSKVDLF